MHGPAVRAPREREEGALPPPRVPRGPPGYLGQEEARGQEAAGALPVGCKCRGKVLTLSGNPAEPPLMSSSPLSAYWRGARGAAPFVLVVGPFGLLFGVVATETGLDLVETMAMTVLVIAGAAQFTALQLMREDAPTVIVIIAALTVNLRTAMYSAALTPHLGAAPLWQRALAAYLLVDQTFAYSSAEYERRPALTLTEKVAFYFGSATPVVPAWIGATLAGALLGRGIPPEYALDFAVPITFLAIMAPMLRTIAHVAAAATAILCALVLAVVPYNGGLLLSALVAMVVGAEVERRRK